MYLEAKISSILYSPKVVVVPFFYFDDDGITKYITNKFKNSTIVSLDWEQILYPINKNIKRPTGGRAIKEVIRVSWSNQRTLELLENGASDNMIWELGNPLFSNEPQKSTRKKVKKIVFIENYNWANKNIKGLKKIATNYSYPLQDLVKETNILRQCRLDTCLSLIKLAYDNQDKLITFRPRPNTQFHEWNKFFKTIVGEIPENFKIDQSGNLTETILANDVCLTNLSTGILEAAHHEKEVALIRNAEYPTNLVYEWEKFIEIIYDYQRLNDLVNIGHESYKNLKIEIDSKYKKELDFFVSISRKLEDLTTGLDNNKIFANVCTNLFRYILIRTLRNKIIQKYVRFRNNIKYDTSTHSRDIYFFILPNKKNK